MRTSTVSNLVSTLKRSKSTIVKRRVKELRKGHDLAAIVSTIKELVSERCSIWSTKQVRGLVKERTGLTVSTSKILHVLKRQLQLSYRKVKRVPFQGNSERNKVLRFLYARRMLEIYQSGKRIINVDESWIPSADFRHRRWKRRGMLNTVPDKLLSQKLNIITAMSSEGEVWIALTTCNTDSNVLMLFMTRLATELTKTSKDWRSSTVFLLDGVSGNLRLFHCNNFVGIVPQV